MPKPRTRSSSPFSAPQKSTRWIRAQGSAGRGALLTFFYCLGLGLPFILSGLAFRRALSVFAVVRRHSQLVMRLGGGMLVVIGLLLMTGLWNELTVQLRVWVSGYSTSI